MEKCFSDAKMYFAAANSFDGFKSNFDKVFSPYRLSKLFILKGGPGTGKSTLMRSVEDHFSGSAAVTKILCSSDIGSLDGVLIERDGVTVGIADGTSPHVIEPRFPGATEELINLGDAFDSRSLFALKGDIIDLSDSKSKSYKMAYHSLKIAGDVLKYILCVLLNYGVYEKAEYAALEITKDDTHASNRASNSQFYISSFSKDGYTALPFLSSEKDMITVCGDGISEYILMRSIYDKLCDFGAIKEVYYSPLSREMIDAIETETRIYTITQRDDALFNTNNFVAKIDCYPDLKNTFDVMMNDARKSFSQASKYHFSLEDIYSKNIDFDRNKDKLTTVIASISELFGK